MNGVPRTASASSADTSGEKWTADPGALAASYAWTRLSAGVLLGVTHVLGNRLHSLGFLRSVPAPGEALDEESSKQVEREIDVCDGLTMRYRQLVLCGHETPVPALMLDSLTEALVLRALHADSRSRDVAVNVNGHSPAVLVAPTALTQALLLVMVALTCHEAARADEVPMVDIEGTADSCTVRICAAGGVPDGDVALAMDAAAWLLRDTRPAPTISRRSTSEWTAVTISLPSLDSSRRAESSST